MFFDPTCKPEVKADPFSLQSLIAWLEKQPADIPYCFTDVGHCLLAQYLNASGLPTHNVNPNGFYLEPKKNFVPLPWVFNRIANGHGDGPSTFGGALYRARKHAAAGE